MTDPLERLAGLYGIGEAYHDYRGDLHYISRQSKRAILAAMGVDVSDERPIQTAIDAFETARWMRLIPQVVVTADAQCAVIPVSIPHDLAASRISWTVILESGEARNGDAAIDALTVESRNDVSGRAFSCIKLLLPASLPTGYHRISVELDTGLKGDAALIVAPHRCYEPPTIAAGKRVWGIAVQLYSLRSAANWGMGDFRDLHELIALAAPLGCDIVGLNPLHALFPAEPTHISPYSPSSRHFLNVLYIAVPDVPEFAECEAAREHVESADFQQLLEELRATGNVDYRRVAAAKFEVLRMLFAHFQTAHLAVDSARALAFRKFVADRGEPLRLHAIFDALDAQLRLQGPQYWGWPSWPQEYREPASLAVSRFARDWVNEVDYFLYLQWLAEEQLYAAQRFARDCGMSVGLYGDVAVGAHPGGSETWSNRHLYLQDASIGAPPDALAMKGQDWGIPPQDPLELRAQEYQPFIGMLRNNMRANAALRLDHVMALFRLWWVPRGTGSIDGAYVHYPLDDLIAILALESKRNRCIVIGEDLGTVPDEVRHAMERHSLNHYKVLLFEKELDGRFKSPSQYARNALATVTTHDLPTLRGWWEGHDMVLRDQLDLYPNENMRTEDRANRGRERAAMMHALVAQRLWHWQAHTPLPEYSAALARAIQAFLGLSSAIVAMIQIEDLIGMSDPANVPGTDKEHPNWQRKVAQKTADIFSHAEVLDMIAAMNTARVGKNPNG